MSEFENQGCYITKNGTKVYNTELLGCYVIEPNKHGDYRGYFQETYNLNTLKEAGIETQFVQGNESFTQKKNTIRGLHFQTDPATQAKLVRCTQGAIYDVAVDLRVGSPTYKKWIKVELSKDNNTQLYLPRGFAHGFVTLTDDVMFEYNVDNDYSKENDAGILWCDPEIGVEWGVENPILSEKDMHQPVLSKSKANFKYKK